MFEVGMGTSRVVPSRLHGRLLVHPRAHQDQRRGDHHQHDAWDGDAARRGAIRRFGGSLSAERLQTRGDRCQMNRHARCVMCEIPAVSRQCIAPTALNLRFRSGP